MSKILLTGGTGFIGSHIASRLIEAGNDVCFLARSGRTESAQERIERTLKFVNPNLSFTPFVFDGDLTTKGLGINLKQLPHIDEVWHAAGSIQFSDEKKEETFSINLDGTLNLLAVLDVIKPREFHYISTAYVCGKHRDVFYEDTLQTGQDFWNPYEESKFFAEQAVRDWAEGNPETRVVIYRPSIIAGDSSSGQVLNFSGFYTFMRTFYLLKKKLERENGRITRDVEGRIVLPIDIRGVADCFPNIIPVDYAVELMLKIRESGEAGTFHVTDQEPKTFNFWLQESTRALGFTGIKAGDGNGPLKDERTSLIEKYKRVGIKDYLPYVSYQPTFDQRNVKQALGNASPNCPKITGDLIRKFLEYAVAKEFKD